MAIDRRTLLRALGAGGAAALTLPAGALAEPLIGTPTVEGALRRSRLFPDQPLRVAHADLHNHSHLSDGAGDHERLFPSLRGHGLDVAALTDHSTISWGAAGEVTAQRCDAHDDGRTHGQVQSCRARAGLDDDGWRIAGQLADAFDDPGRFVALRGFEWTSPTLGHVNVWFTRNWIDALHTGGIDASGLGHHFEDVAGHGLPDDGAMVREALEAVGRANPSPGTMQAFYRWLGLPPAGPGLGGGGDGLACFCHPGREPNRFAQFAYDPLAAGQLTTMEILNRREDYLFKGADEGHPSPLVEALDAGWRVGLIGVTDEHGPDWGRRFDPPKGRAGLWVPNLSRQGVRQAIEQRRAFATREPGLRLDAACDGVPMGRTVSYQGGSVRFALDVSGGGLAASDRVEVQVLRPAGRRPGHPDVVHVETARAGGDGDVISFDVPGDVLDPARGDWIVLRVAAPDAASDAPAPFDHPCNNRALAYASPFWLTTR